MPFSLTVHNYILIIIGPIKLQTKQVYTLKLFDDKCKETVLQENMYTYNVLVKCMLSNNFAALQIY